MTDIDLERIERAADEELDDAVAFLREMIRTPSVNPPGDYDGIHALVSETFESFGWDAETLAAPAALLEELGLEGPRPNVLGYVTRGDGPTIVLNAHLDTVPVDESKWSYDPFAATLDEGRVWGRGARDSKGRVAAYTLAARALEAADMVPADATIVLAITVDEETGGHAGPGYVVDSGVLDADYAIVEGNIDRVDYAAAGVVHFEVTVSGRSAHAGTNPEKGANAVVGASRIVGALDAYADRLKTERVSDVPGIGHATCTPATIEGGLKTNVVPSSCSFTVDRRVLPEEDLDDAERAFRDVVADVDLPDGTSAAVDVVLRARPFESDSDGPLVRSLARHAETVTGSDVLVGGTRGFTDARFFGHAGIETAKYGPGDEESNVHGPDENVKVDQVRDAGAVVAATLAEIGSDR
ncbi:ArgE/DapE family deacylase [Halorubrum sp. JWXQ-INN 858]|uniref:M20 family metallopeptidase n=1 Tax=Halorubrum sp. JWXQ-INN 858 TaxID=2690782 RepID=UPI001356AA57|nr:ArgE/DapE family deacylase [Halorubrum sp. JWXQ-INN 858]MWV64870.1 ArgE/DapE family deacylase [Halorubrum sp. JWXQ-INN 858]